MALLPCLNYLTVKQLQTPSSFGSQNQPCRCDLARDSNICLRVFFLILSSKLSRLTSLQVWQTLYTFSSFSVYSTCMCFVWGDLSSRVAIISADAFQCCGSGFHIGMNSVGVLGETFEDCPQLHGIDASDARLRALQSTQLDSNISRTEATGRTFHTKHTQYSYLYWDPRCG